MGNRTGSQWLHQRDRSFFRTGRRLWIWLVCLLALSSIGARIPEDPVRPILPPKNNRIVDRGTRLLNGWLPFATANFLPNIQVNNDPGNLQDEFGPAIAVGNSGMIGIVWNVEEPGDEGVYFSRSEDGGATFSSPVRITDEFMDAEVDYNFPPRLAVDQSGFIHVVWHDTRSGTSRCYYDRSPDGGQTFFLDIIVHQNQDIVSHSLPRIAEDGNGGVYLTWMDKSNGNSKFDVFFAMARAYCVLPENDYDGDDQADISVFRPSDGMWFIKDGGSLQWGVFGDIPVTGDYDGDTTADPAVWRPRDGLWYVSGLPASPWGVAGDIPVPHDYNGGGITDLAVWRPSDGVWYVTGVGGVQWGQAGDYPVPRDYNGDGVDEVAVWRPANGEWFIYGGGYLQWGTAGDIPVPADYNGDGTTDIAVYRPSTGMWYIQYTGGGTAAAQWGTAADIPVPGDYDGNGTTDVAIWRPSDGLWYIYGGSTTHYGQTGDIPLVR